MISFFILEDNDNLDKEIEFLGFSLWLKFDNIVDDKLLWFFKEEESFGSGEDVEEVFSMLSEMV